MGEFEIRWAGTEDIRSLQMRTDACRISYSAHDAFSRLKQSIPRIEPQDWALYTHAVLALRDGKPAAYALVDLPFEMEPGARITPENPGTPIAQLKQFTLVDPEAARSPDARRALLEFILKEAHAHGVRKLYIDRVNTNDDEWTEWLREQGFAPKYTFHIMAKELDAKT